MRRAGRVPGVVYGRGLEPVSVSVDTRELATFLRTSADGAALVDLTLTGNGDGQPRLCLVKEVQRDPVTRRPLNVDFLNISLDEEIAVTVPVVGEGEPIGVTEGGILEQALRQLSISCLPTAIPDEIRIDISGLAIGQALHVSDLGIPEGVTVEADPEEMVVRVSAPAMIEEEEEELPEGEVPEGEEAEAAGEEQPDAEGEGADEETDGD